MAQIIPPSAAWRRHEVEELGLLIDGHDYYRELYAAMLTAKKTIFLTGWQFDSGVTMLRGEDAEGVDTPLTLLGLLEHLCEKNPELSVRILAWDFNVVFAPEREWMQELIFHWNTHDRVKFRFDSHHVELASQHQKFVVIDDDIVFTGGLDICDHRWDKPSHCFKNDLRISRGEMHQPFHDIQLYAKSRPFAESLKRLFAKRWAISGGDSIENLLGGAPVRSSWRPASAKPVAAREVVLGRTDPYGEPEAKGAAIEIKEVYLSAIANAQKHIYAETQYLSSRTITEALIARMNDRSLPKLELVFILNTSGETLKEQGALGLNQAQNIARLRQCAEANGQQLGLYVTLPYCEADDERPERGTYIHSKLMIVDDTFMTIGSANLTDRSLGVDTELNVSVEAKGADDPLVASLRTIRAGLLTEHIGLDQPIDPHQSMLAQIEAAQGPGRDACRLRVHPSPTEGERTALSLIDPDKLPFDPDAVEELDVGTFNALIRDWRKLWSAGRDEGSAPVP
ncbi:MAG: phospholipase [Myxococcaceae bacterium]|nr:phospholipase [Myxococcaceae bacterium]